jgi:hypothetical protein
MNGAEARGDSVCSARDELLPGSRLAGDQHGRVLWRHSPDGGEDRTHYRRATDHPGNGAVVSRRHRSALEQLRDPSTQHIGFDRLREKVIGADVEGAHRAFHRPETADHEHRNLLAPDSQRLHELNTVDSWHSDVEQDEIVATCLERLGSGVRVRRDVDFMTIGAQERSRRHTECVVVVDNEQTRHILAHSRQLDVKRGAGV